MAKALCVDSWSRQQHESNQRIYSKINEMRAWMGMPLMNPGVEVPSYESKKEEPDYLESMRKACERAAEIVERMKRWPTRSQDCTVVESWEVKLSRESMVEGDTTVISQCDPLVLNRDQYPAKLKKLVVEDSTGEFSGIDGTDECQSTSLLFEPPILQSTVFNDDAMGLNRPSFLEGFKSENPSNPRLNPTPSNLEVCLNRVELGKEDHGVNGSRVLHTEINNTVEDSTQQVVPSKVVQVTEEPFVDAYHLFDEMLKENFEIFQHSKVTFVPSVDSKMVYDDMGDMCDHSIDWIGSRVYVGVTKSIECLGNHLAHKVFVGIPHREMPMEFNKFFVFDPGGALAVFATGPTLRSNGVETILVFDPGGDLLSFFVLQKFCLCVWH